MEDLIPFGTIKDEFKTHLENNPKILFSAPYGLGKTTFLKEFFKGNEEYIPIHLFPVNYSISSNEDILSLLKYDILVSLLSNNNVLVQLDSFKPHLTQSLAPYFEEHWKHLTVEVFNAVVKFKTGIDEFDKLKEIQKKFTIDDNKEIQEFLTKHENAKVDRITEIISNTLTAIQESDKKVVLIIDDLDRVDPEHVFRLINVFSAYVDQDSRHNLFGFDHVIFVCDLENIKSIYHHRYGENTNFHSYIDKFYSSSPYSYDFFKILGDNIYRLLKKNRFQENYDEGNGAYDKIILILRYFINANILSTRTLINQLNKSLNNTNIYFNLESRHNSFLAEEISIVHTFCFLDALLGKSHFIELTKRFQTKDYNPKSEGDLWSHLVSECYALYTVDYHNYKLGKGINSTYNEKYRIYLDLDPDKLGQIKSLSIKDWEPISSRETDDISMPLDIGKKILADAIEKFYKLPRYH